MSEWDDMEVIPDEDPRERDRLGSYYAIMKRIRFHREFFERAYAMQPRCTALFGEEAEDAFTQLQSARRAIEVACEMLTYHIKQPADDEAMWFSRSYSVTICIIFLLWSDSMIEPGQAHELRHQLMVGDVRAATGR
jgi:hypothetical protein